MSVAHPVSRSQIGPDAESPTLRLVALIFSISIILQRLCLTIGSSFLSIVGPLGLLLAFYGMIAGVLALHRTRLMLFIGFVCYITLGAAVRAALPEQYGASASWMSLIQLVAVTAFGVFVMPRQIDEARFFGVINRILLLVAQAGIIQIVIQVAGIRAFSFQGLVPARFLLEGPYNTVIPIGSTGYFKANGLFLVEPSVFSQFMALAIIIEMLMFRRVIYLLSFAAALMASVSGTGWLMLASFVMTVAFCLGRRGVVLSLATIVVASVGLATLAFLFPSAFEVFFSRSDEIFNMDTSGHLRFVTPWWLADYVLSRTPWVALYGLGAGVSEHLAMQPPWDYNLNPPVKIILEYGIPCFGLYFCFIVTGQKTMTQKALVVPILVLLFFDGGYSQFPPVLFPAMLLIMTANLSPDAERVRTLASPALPERMLVDVKN